MITRSSTHKENIAQLRRGATIVWIPHNSSWLITVSVEIEGYGVKSAREYCNDEQMGRYLERATARLLGFVEGFYDRG